MNARLHKTLERQLKKHFDPEGNLPEGFQNFINAISATYESYEDDINLLQNSIEISSNELRTAIEKQKEDAEAQKKTIANIQEAIAAIKPQQNHLDQYPNLPKNPSALFETLIKLIDEQKKAQFEIRKLSKAVEQNPASIVITNTDGAIEYVNQKFYKVTGFSEDEVIGKNLNILKSGHHPDEYYANMWETIQSGKQ